MLDVDKAQHLTVAAGLASSVLHACLKPTKHPCAPPVGSIYSPTGNKCIPDLKIERVSAVEI